MAAATSAAISSRRRRITSPLALVGKCGAGVYGKAGPCQQCGATPAKKVVFQSIAGMVIMHQIRTVKGNFCRDCGLRIKDEMNAYTLKRGWFSIGGIIGIPMFLGINAIRAGRLNKLPAPVRSQPQGWQGQPQGQAWPGQPQPWQGQSQC
jgi:hypothetical protein